MRSNKYNRIRNIRSRNIRIIVSILKAIQPTKAPYKTY